MSVLKISSTAFPDNGNIPSKYTCDGTDINPPLFIENVPQEAKSLVLIVDDPDAPMGTWVHWVVWNISPRTKEIKENDSPQGASFGLNDFRKKSYGGPCPPSGTHRYFFKLYALDTALDLPAGAKKGDVEKAMKGHIISQTQTIGLYKRSRQ
ncbi:MAG: YbhB/YbcL family Raf kinase inhibitor-like protein [Nitrospirae bacterium]|nr:YbhB/YbcL family Raf kinase inhibitor-like protein [Nitrospirota bacterium]